MAARKTISYQATARLAVIGGAVSLLAVFGAWAMSDAGPDASALADALAILGTIAWFLGAASGVLSLSTPHARTGAVGLALCGVSAVAVIVTQIIGA